MNPGTGVGAGSQPLIGADAPKKHQRIKALAKKLKPTAEKVKFTAGMTLGLNIFGAAATTVVLSAISAAAIIGSAVFFLTVVLLMLKNIADLGSVALPAMSLAAI